jgi:hypothetical protein
MQQSAGLLLAASLMAATHLFSFPIGNENASRFPSAPPKQKTAFGRSFCFGSQGIEPF